MIKKLICLISVINFTVFYIGLKAQDFEWVKENSDKGVDKKMRITTGKDKDVYLALNFSDKITVSGKSVTSMGGIDFSIGRYNSKGELDWLISDGGLGNDRINDIICDESGDVYITGCFTGNVVLDNIQLTSYGKEDVYVAKYDKHGKCKWAITAGGEGHDVANSIGIDKDDNVIITGLFSSTAWFENSSLVSLGETDIFVAKYNKKQKLVWAKSIKGNDNRSQSTALTISNNDIIIAGNFYNNLIIDNTKLIKDTSFANLNFSGSFLAYLDKNGTLVWNRLLVASMSDSYINVDKGLISDSKGNIYLSGGVIGQITTGDSKFSSKNNGNQDLFIVSFDSYGKWKWIKVSDSEEYSYGRDMVTSMTYKEGLIYATGYFDGSFLLDKLTIRSSGELYDSDIFIVAFDENGDAVWGKSAGAFNSDYFKFNDIASDVAVNSKGEVFISGMVKGDAMFETIEVKAKNQNKSIFAKIYQVPLVIENNDKMEDTLSVVVYPNPIYSENLNVKIEGTGDKVSVLLYDDMGNLIRSVYDGKTKKKENYYFQIKENELKRGTYQIKIISNTKSITVKTMVVK